MGLTNIRPYDTVTNFLRISKPIYVNFGNKVEKEITQ